MGKIVVVAYRPREGAEARLLELIRDHVPILRREGLATDRDPLILRAAGGILVEVFEWSSTEAIEQSHSHQAVLELWAKFASACEYVPLVELAESRDLFASFEPIEG